MFIQFHLTFLLTSICSNTFAAIHDEAYIIKNGPFGLILLKKNDTFVDWARIPEVHYNQWIYALKVWRTSSIILGVLCLFISVLILAYIIYSFRTDPSGPFDCFGGDRPDDVLNLANENRPANIQQFAIQRQLKRLQQQTQ